MDDVPVFSSAEDHRARKARILFVDDEERILRAMQAMFRRTYDVSTTTNGLLVPEMLKNQHFHVIVSDQRMPEIEGVAVLRMAKDISPSTVRILLTGFADLAAITGSVNEGEIFRYLSKPWNIEELEDSIASAARIGLELADAKTEPANAEQPSTSITESMYLLFVDPTGNLAGECGTVAGLRAISAPNLHKALDLMQKFLISIVVIAIDENEGECVEFLNVLKSTHPHIVTLVVARSADTALLVRLINAARVFRVIFRPVKTALSQIYLTAAMKQAARFRAAPVLTKTQQAVKRNVASGMLSILGQRFRAIKSLFGTN